MEITKLSDIDKGRSAMIVAINGKEDIKRRFMELGMVEGTRIKCVLSSGTGAMRAYSVRGCVIAIRKSDADRIMVDGVEYDG